MPGLTRLALGRVCFSIYNSLSVFSHNYIYVAEILLIGYKTLNHISI